MQIRLVAASCAWQARYPQAGSIDGWSEWETIDRQHALHFIERGWDYQHA